MPRSADLIWSRSRCRSSASRPPPTIIAPWPSVHKLHLLTDPPLTFVLTSGGHNALIVSPPGHEGRTFHSHTRAEGSPYVPPESWEAVAEVRNGSWWPALTDWLDALSGAGTPPPTLGTGPEKYRPREDAPGTYVLQK